MLNGWSDPTSPQSAGGDEIFRRDATATSGYEWKNESGTWADAPYFDDATHADGIGEINNSSSTQTIEGKVFKNLTSANGDHCLRMSNVSNKTIKRCLFVQGIGLAIYLYGGSTNVTIRECFITNVKRGILVQNCDAGTIKVHANQFLNMIWDRTAGGDIKGQFIQVSITTAAPDVELTSNRGVNYFGESENEDLINIFGSGGTSGSPFLVKGNIFVGGAWSTSGGGILAGDVGGQYVDFDSNYLVNPGRYGFQNAGGDEFNFTNNKLYAATLPWNVVGFYMAAGCTNTTLGTTNESNYKDHTGANVDFPGWAGCGGAVSPTINTSMTPAIMNVPDHLLTYMSEDDIYYLRSLKVLYTELVSSGDTYPSESSADVNVRRPAASFSISGSGSTQTLTSTSTAGTGGSGTNTLTGYAWTKISGSGTITSPTASSTTITGLSGTTVVRLIVTQTNGQFGFPTTHSVWNDVIN